MNDFKTSSYEMDKKTYIKYKKTLKMVEKLGFPMGNYYYYYYYYYYYNYYYSPVINSLQLFTCICVVTDSGSIQVHIWLAIELERFLPITKYIFIFKKFTLFERKTYFY